MNLQVDPNSILAEVRKQRDRLADSEANLLAALKVLVSENETLKAMQQAKAKKK